MWRWGLGDEGLGVKVEMGTRGEGVGSNGAHGGWGGRVWE